MEETKHYVAYYRVSREDQGKSGLGLKAQRRAVLDFIEDNGILSGEFQDIESGASETRSGMIQAIQQCKVSNATLVVKEMSRISRGGFKFRQQLEDSNINFIECSSPYDPEVVKDIKFALSKEERTKVRQRTKDALAEIKDKLQRGEVHISKSGRVVKSLGKPENLSETGRLKSIEVRRDKANNNLFNKRAGAYITELKKSDLNLSLGKIADKLNQAGFLTSRGSRFNAIQVSRVYSRYTYEINTK
jgi:DNA invertase Pin-like site-specific DNA recombinase